MRRGLPVHRKSTEEHPKAHGKLPVTMRFFASAETRRTVLALVLCSLAVLFAVEAKTAWYGPTTVPGSDIQSQKARPADVPAVVSHGVSNSPWITCALTLIFLASAGAIASRVAGAFSGAKADSGRIPVSAAHYFSPGLFFRPPPAL